MCIRVPLDGCFCKQIHGLCRVHHHACALEIDAAKIILRIGIPLCRGFGDSVGGFCLIDWRGFSICIHDAQIELPGSILVIGLFLQDGKCFCQIPIGKSRVDLDAGVSLLRLFLNLFGTLLRDRQGSQAICFRWLGVCRIGTCNGKKSRMFIQLMILFISMRSFLEEFVL